MKHSALAVVLIGLVGVSPAWTAPVTFFGEDSLPGENVRVSPYTNAAAAQSNFLSFLTGVEVETLESFSPGATGPLAVNFGSTTATLSGNGSIQALSSGTSLGRYPISGDNYWETAAGFTIEFSAEQVAFGFFGVDIGDFNGQMSIVLEGINGTQEIVVPHTIGNDGGDVLFFGVIDVANPFTKITFKNSSPDADWFAFDDFTIGSIDQIREDRIDELQDAPEPSSVVLLSLGALGLGYYRVRNRSRSARKA
ncbi:MAG: PEP-CTERM sorting domain-containing protein [Gemmataceae bacterium]